MKAIAVYLVTTKIEIPENDFGRLKQLAKDKAEQNSSKEYGWAVNSVHEIDKKKPKCFGSAKKVMESDHQDCDDCSVVNECVNRVHF